MESSNIASDPAATDLDAYITEQRKLPENQPATEPERVPTIMHIPNCFERKIQSDAERAEDERKRQRYYRWQEIINSRGERYANCRLADLEVYDGRQRAAIEEATKFGEQMADHLRTGTGIVFYGAVGTGKDHMLAALLRHAVGHYDQTARWLSGQEFYGQVRDAMDSGERESTLVNRLVYPNILAISDPLPPFGDLSQHQSSMLFRVVDGRYSAGKSTWVTINVAKSEEAEKRMGVAIWDRIRHGAIGIHCDWSSYRKR